jgi:orotate phosphoribosyltransferase
MPAVLSLTSRPELPPLADARLADIRAQIVRFGVHKRSEGAVIISPKGRPQNWLIDLRRVFLQQGVLEQIALAFWTRFQDQRPFQIGAMESAAIPLLTALMIYAPKEREGLNAFLIRKERKGAGSSDAIEGEVTDEPILLIDDVINSGASAEKARAVIAQAGHRIAKVFVVVDYRSKRGVRWRAERAIEVSSLFTPADLNLAVEHDSPAARQRYLPLWRAETAGAFPYNVVPKSAPVLTGRLLYRGSDAGRMQAFDAHIGTIVWEYTVKAAGRKGIMSTPLVHDGRLYFGAFNGIIYSLDAATGVEVWTQTYGEWVGCSPIIAPRHGLVYFCIESTRPWAHGSLGGFATDTGVKVWEHQVRKRQHGSPAYWKGGDLILWGTADHQMLALDAGTGSIVWTFTARRAIKSAPAIDEERGLVAFGSFDSSIYLLDLVTGEKLGEWETGEICYTTPLFVGNKLFCGSGDRHLYVIDVECREVLEKVPMRGRVYGSPKLIGGRVVVASSGGLLMEIDPKTLKIKGRLQLSDAVTNAVAATDDGRRIFVSTYMNHLYAFERLSPSGGAPA